MGKGKQHAHQTGLHAGDLLLWRANEQQEIKLFAVVGATYAETALLRLVSGADAMPPQPDSAYEIRYRIKWQQEKAEGIIYADLSKLVVKKSEDIVSAISKHPGTIAGTLSKRDVDTILQKLLEEKTISPDLKNKYLP